jgi:hypothetical protein
MIREEEDVLENASFDDGAHDGVHAGAVAPRSENGNFHCGGWFVFLSGGTEQTL